VVPQGGFKSVVGFKPQLITSWIQQCYDPTVTRYIVRVIRPNGSEVETIVEPQHIDHNEFVASTPMSDLFACSSVAVQLIACRGDDEQLVAEKATPIRKSKLLSVTIIYEL